MAQSSNMDCSFVEHWYTPVRCINIYVCTYILTFAATILEPCESGSYKSLAVLMVAQRECSSQQ